MVGEKSESTGKSKLIFIVKVYGIFLFAEGLCSRGLEVRNSANKM